MEIDGGNQKNLTNNNGSDTNPFFSPTGDRIAYISDRDGNLEIYIMDLDGSNQLNLTNNPSVDYGFSFQPWPE